MGGLGFHLFISRIPERVFSIKSPLSLSSPPPWIHSPALSSALTDSMPSGTNADNLAGGWNTQDGLGFLLSLSKLFQQGFSSLILLLLLLLTPGCQQKALLQCLAFEHSFALVLVTEILWIEELFGISIHCLKGHSRRGLPENTVGAGIFNSHLQSLPGSPGHAEALLKFWRRSSHVLSHPIPPRVAFTTISQQQRRSC